MQVQNDGKDNPETVLKPGGDYFCSFVTSGGSEG